MRSIRPAGPFASRQCLPMTKRSFGRASPSMLACCWKPAATFFDNPFATAALLSFELGALDPPDFGNCLLPSINPIYGLICLSSHHEFAAGYRIRPGHQVSVSYSVLLVNPSVPA